MALDEKKAERSVFLSDRKEAGFNAVYDPQTSSFLYQVFIHKSFPYTELNSWEFDSFEQARSFAASYFATNWEMLFWNGELNRPCKNEECGQGRSGNCAECASGGGCKSCGATEDVNFNS
jgi:hypothetical protein